MLTRLFTTTLLLLALATLTLTTPTYESLPSLRAQHALHQTWVDTRTLEVIPSLLAQHNVEMWILSMREYNEDQAFWGMVNRIDTFAARRRTVLVYYRSAKTGEFRQWQMVDNTDKVWDDLNAVLYEVDPASIVLDTDATGNNFADGLHAGESETLLKHLPWSYWLRVQRKPLLATQFVATRVEGMLEMYQKVMRNAHAVIREGFSSDVITPGVTTTNDLVWFFRDRIQSLNMTTWFQPGVDAQRFDPFAGTVQTLTGDAVIEKGDFLWTDFGVTFMGLNTDTQHNGYVLRDGESDAPIGLQRGLWNHSNAMQDIVMREIAINRTGNEILASSLDNIKSLNISGTVYCHPIGDFGHAAGSLIGMTNLQQGVPVLGDIPIFPDMWYSVELQANVPVPEWNNQIVNFRQEEDIYLGEGGPFWVVGRQNRLILVGGSGVREGQGTHGLVVQEEEMLE
ncbi:hypothetical protein HDU98_007939 [Podochytrium sp. JEL0797]|nr:hypothetical protein HDU98_007939 [Podochytrium sp. JEL0797]